MDYQIIELEEFNVIGIRYELSKSLSNNVKLAQNHWKILNSKFLRVEHIGNMNKLKDTINYVYKEIIPKNNILVENRQFVYFEKYDYKFHWNREDSVIEIYIPIK